MESQIISIHADACHLPFAEQYFDAVISVDAYQYFGANEQYLDDHLTPLVKEGGKLAIAMSGVKMEFDGDIPVELQPFLSLSEVDNQWHTCDWWRKLWEPSPNIYVESVREMKCFSKAWYEWLQCNNDYARAN
ncbi:MULTISPECIES: class I SAM-dependent methyltransferase [unclassified Paenibacillus]|uniref:class I SAM-dependent methyltransferase n=1 Tax=unclassified Paenibacillus TaxID=185978 RepID=UPI0008E73CFB|nr:MULTISPECIES: methyltransferase domain-containing protein [unclassified Paenibacillus]SFR11759.1 Methyltransferase domain-containing protein [Paenibacillus sp. cl130]